jgi:IS30 family transposase
MENSPEARYFLKITDFKQITQAEVVSAATRLNNRPRKLLDYRTPGELMKAARKKLAA